MAQQRGPARLRCLAARAAHATHKIGCSTLKAALIMSPKTIKNSGEILEEKSQIKTTFIILQCRLTSRMVTRRLPVKRCSSGESSPAPRGGQHGDLSVDLDFTEILTKSAWNETSGAPCESVTSHKTLATSSVEATARWVQNNGRSRPRPHNTSKHIKAHRSRHLDTSASWR